MYKKIQLNISQNGIILAIKKNKWIQDSFRDIKMTRGDNERVQNQKSNGKYKTGADQTDLLKKDRWDQVP